MNHAILIMAHKDIEQVCRLVEYFCINCYVFIHWDKKQFLSDVDVERLYSYKQVKLVSQKYEVNWGGTSILACELYLLQYAKCYSDAEYFHLISGQDYPTRSIDCFLEFFLKNKGKEYVQYVHLPHPKWENNTFRRLQYFYPYDYANNQENPRQWVREQVRKQQADGLKRPIPDEFDHIYGSSQWFSISRDATSILLDYTQKSPSLYRRMWMTFAPEECYIATVLVNLLGTERVVQKNLRFIRWKYENGNRPANLGAEHFFHLLNRDYFFCRKIDSSCSLNLLDYIDKYLLNDNCFEGQTSTGGWIYDGFLKYERENVFCSFVSRLCADMGVKTAVDMGCGCGYYVAQWRSMGLAFAGYDANPYTPSLSRMLLPDGDLSCGVADITEIDLVISEPFDLVVCKDVLPYISEKKERIAVSNLARLSSHAILLSWKTPGLNIDAEYREVVESDIIGYFEEEGFIVERYMTERLHVMLRRKDCCLLLKRGKQLIINYNK